MDLKDKEIVDAMLELGLTNQIRTVDEVKRAYFKLCKKYHPDQINENNECKEKFLQKYLKIQHSYKILEKTEICSMQQAFLKYLFESESKYMNKNTLNKSYFNNYGQTENLRKKREAKVFGTNKEAARQQARQQSFAFDKKKMEEKYKTKRTNFQENQSDSCKNTEQDQILKQIETIWLAEIIHRQIELDKKQKEKENIKKLYQAFMKREDIIK